MSSDLRRFLINIMATRMTKSSIPTAAKTPPTSALFWKNDVGLLLAALKEGVADDVAELEVSV